MKEIKCSVCLYRVGEVWRNKGLWCIECVKEQNKFDDKFGPIFFGVIFILFIICCVSLGFSL